MKRFLTLALCALLTTVLHAQSGKDILRCTADSFFLSPKAQEVGNQVLLYQRATGGWPKNIDMTRPLSAADTERVSQDRLRTDDSTIDNGATTLQITFLARLYQARIASRSADKKLLEQCKTAVGKGIKYLLEGQYDNGGWPQFWPNGHGYQLHITFNDDAMVNTLRLLSKVSKRQPPFDKDLVSDTLSLLSAEAFQRGIECILATQIRVGCELTIWCQQHDRTTLLPAPARSYELPSFCTAESAAIVGLLKDIPQPDSRICAAIHGAMQWFMNHAIHGFRYDRSTGDARLIEDADASPLWARFYDLEQGFPFVCDRDGIPRRKLDEIGEERRNGYAWYNTRPFALLHRYQTWKAEHAMDF